MIEVDYSHVIEATDELDFFGFFALGLGRVGHRLRIASTEPVGACWST